MSWLMLLRTLLRDLKRSKASSPNKRQFEQLHVKTYESDKQSGFGNIDFIGDFVRTEKCRAEIHCMEVILSDSKSAQYCSDYVSSLLGSWITALSQQAVNKLQITQKHQFHIHNDTYSHNVFSEITMSFPHKTKVISPFLSTIIRERDQPESAITSAELYFIFAMAASHYMLLNTEKITIRVLIVYSFWVQILNVNTTSKYIASITEGLGEIVDNMEIYQTPWFSFLDDSCQLRILLFAFEDISLESRKATKVRIPLQGMKPIAERNRSKRKLDGEEVGKKRQKLCTQSYKDANN